MATTLKRIGLTGGVGSGKSLVSDLFRQAGITVINLDDLGRELYTKIPMLASLVAAICGKQVLVNLKLDFSKIREVIFSSAEKRKQLEALLHPMILKEFEARCEKSANEGAKIIVCEAALLIESGYYKSLDELVVILAPREERKKRLIDRDKISETLVEKMLASQVEDEKRIDAATMQSASTVIRNDGTKADLKAQVLEVLRGWRQKHIL